MLQYGYVTKNETKVKINENYSADKRFVTPLGFKHSRAEFVTHTKLGSSDLPPGGKLPPNQLLIYRKRQRENRKGE
jgi:hypothetical protein